MKLIFNADDYGLCRKVNEGIIDSHLNGVVSSTTMMVAMPGESDALLRLKQAPELSVGIHLRLTAGSPMSSNYPLVNENGLFLSYQQLMVTITPEHKADIYKELRRQIEHFLNYDIQLSHIDSHHHVHLHPVVHEVVKKLSEEFGVPYRAQPELKQYLFTDGFYDVTATLDWLIPNLRKWALSHSVVEVMCHPGIADKELVSMSSYSTCREHELEVLKSAELRSLLTSNAITLSNYSAVV
ncbi:chitin disaccharide deacetylase [Vibrio sp. ZSDZ65]|uniref:Chitin disaccharide deacetylase n=1 Tax=Vibrio qingdaonensis TaxID=2829491 RepID=A0A9X3CRB9_9VIBR|nr:chitin disaccharide deacetylase [Vibrio qingdaonensis]MCW8348326.1 chitin disaccharide deacetylase [Vibrio qingdaonensis]